MSILEYPVYDDYRLVRSKIVNAKDYPTESKLYKAVSISKDRFSKILTYMLATNRVIKTKDKKLIWINADTTKLKKLISESVPVV